MFNTPAEQVVCNYRFGRGTESIGNKDMIVVVVILIPLAKNDYKLDGYITIIQLCPERIGFMWNFRAIRIFEFDVFDFTPGIFAEKTLKSFAPVVGLLKSSHVQLIAGVKE